MISVLNIEPNNMILRSKLKGDIRYNFLKNLKGNYNVECTKYYDLLNSLDTFKLKNVYRFLYLRTYKINEKTDCDISHLKRKDGKISGEELNEYLNNYINPGEKDSILKTIIIMNGIQLYFFPNVN